MSRRQTGFTLIELIVVIVILGILAATALPKFMGIQGGARASILQGARGAVASAMNIATATQQSLNAASNVSVTLDSTTITMVNRYPTAASIFTAAGLSADYSAIQTSAGPPAVVRIQVVNASTPANCSFTYTEATAASAPGITVADPSGC